MWSGDFAIALTVRTPKGLKDLPHLGSTNHKTRCVEDKEANE
jgi:hypothetical protein